MSAVLSVLSCLAAILFAVSCGVLLLTVWATRRFTQLPPVAPLPPDRQLPVTVLKPLHGLDFALEENLRSFCRQDYPEFQIVFGFARATDPALPVVEALRREFPQLDIQIVVDPARPFCNQKVCNLANMLRAARHPWLVLVDSDMRVQPDYLATVTAPLADAGVGAVTCLYRGLAEDGLGWSRLGALHIDFEFLPQALLGHRLGVGDGCFGATIALPRSVLDRLGGFAAIGDQLADDHALGQAVLRSGLRLELSPYLVDTVVHEPTFGDLLAHELRWARTVLLVQSFGYVGSLLTHLVPLALLLAAMLPARAAVAIVLLAIGLRWLAARAEATALRVTAPNPLTLLARDLLSFAVFVASFFPQKLIWRGHKFKTVGNNLAVPPVTHTHP